MSRHVLAWHPFSEVRLNPATSLVNTTFCELCVFLFLLPDYSTAFLFQESILHLHIPQGAGVRLMTVLWELRRQKWEDPEFGGILWWVPGHLELRREKPHIKQNQIQQQTQNLHRFFHRSRQSSAPDDLPGFPHTWFLSFPTRLYYFLFLPLCLNTHQEATWRHRPSQWEVWQSKGGQAGFRVSVTRKKR